MNSFCVFVIADLIVMVLVIISMTLVINQLDRMIKKNNILIRELSNDVDNIIEYLKEKENGGDY